MVGTSLLVYRDLSPAKGGEKGFSRGDEFGRDKQAARSMSHLSRWQYNNYDGDDERVRM